MQTKICKRCGIEKNIDRFLKEPRMRCGYKSVCKDCDNIRAKESWELKFGRRKLTLQKELVEQGKKKCNICGEIKLLEYFYKDKNCIGGVQSSCIPCSCERVSSYKQWKDPARRLYMNEYNYRKRHERWSEYLEKVRLYNKTDAKQKYIKKYNQRKQVKIAHTLRSRIYYLVKKQRCEKFGKTEKMLGCTYVEFCQYIESLWQEGMSWENYGLWQIDHIRPCASFDLSKIEQQLSCLNFTNMQPLWKSDNIKKGSKWLGKRWYRIIN
jgi:hypothetical protein